MVRHTLILIISFFFFINNSVEASHEVGGVIKYTYQGPGSVAGTHKYKVILGIIRDCNSSSTPAYTQRITAVCMPRGTNLIVHNAPRVYYVSKPGERPANFGAKDISDLCRNKSSKCLNRFNPGGYEVKYYETIFELPACNYWEIYMSPSQCCRIRTTNMTGSYFAPVTRLNNTSFPLNNSPIFSDEVKPIPNVCTGQDILYSIGAHDPDGDSLSYVLSPAIDRITSPGIYTYARYNAGFSAAIPIPGIKLDSTTGLITFKTSRTGMYLVAFWVIEYERCTGKEVGRTMHEVPFSVRTCTNNVPTDISGISTVMGATKKGKYKIEVCRGTKFSWQDTIYDKDLTDTLRFGTNLKEVMPGAKMTTTFLSRNKAVVKFEWTASLGNNPYKIFFLKYDDDRCDIPGKGSSVFEISVKNGTSAGEDQIVCKGDTSILSAEGGRHYTWRSLSSIPLTVGVNWFPDTTTSDTGKTGKFVPTVSTYLEVKSDLRLGCLGSSNCNNIDTILIKVANSFKLKTTPDFYLCHPAKGQLNVDGSNNKLKYSYRWNNSQLINNDSIKNPLFSNVKSLTSFQVTVTSDSGCVRTSNVQVKVTQPFLINAKALVSDSLVCLSKNIKMWVDQGKVDYEKCGKSKYQCQGNFKQFSFGKGVFRNDTSLSNSPMVYGSIFYSQKTQFMYLASELRALKMEAGPIKSISFFIDSLFKGTATTHNNFTIKLGCSSLNELPKDTFLTGSNTVFYSSGVIVKKGWNEHIFNSEYNWDGKSNLIVEICWDNPGAQTGNHIHKFDSKSYRSANRRGFITPGQGPQCNFLTAFPNTAYYLPQTKFNSCTGIRKGIVKYNWQPSSNGGFIGATNKDTANALAHLSTSKKYTVYLSDSATGLCKDTLSLSVNVVSSYNSMPNSLPIQCLENGIIKLTSPTPWNIIKPGGRWSGKGITNDTLGYWDPNKSGLGSFWVKYSVTGDRCATADSIQIKVVGLPDPSLMPFDSLCGIYGGGSFPDTIRHRLSPKNPGGWFSGYGVDSVLNGNRKMVYFVNGTLFNPSKGKPDTAFVTYTLLDGCFNDSLSKIPVVAPWDHSFLGVNGNGAPYSTINFCVTNPSNDTLTVAGPNPIWQYLDYAPAMVNRNIGVLDAKLASFGKDTIGRIKVGNYGFCGTDTTIRVRFVRPPEIELIPEIYCNNVVQDTIFFTKKDTMLFRIPKGPLLAGSTGKKTLNPNGFDPATEVKVKYASIAKSGWPQAIDQSVNQYDYNFWDGKPWLRTIRLGAYRIATVQFGKNEVRYTLGFRYRNNHPNFACQISDTTYVELKDSLIITLADTSRICGANTLKLDAGKFLTADYIWENGYINQTRVVSTQGTYSVTVTSEFCVNTKQTVVINGCVGIEENLENGVSLKLYPNPASTNINIELHGIKSESTQLRITTLMGAEISKSVFNTSEANNSLEIDVSALAKGIYLFEIKNGESRSTYRVVVE